MLLCKLPPKSSICKNCGSKSKTLPH